MEISNFENFIKETRESFKDTLKHSTGVKECLDVIIKAFDECSNEFEELTLIENLREEYDNYCAGLAAE